MESIQSAQNPKIRHLSKLLTQSKARREHRQTVLEGIHLLQSYLDAGHTPRCVYIPESRLTHPEVARLLPLLPENTVYIIAAGLLAKISSLECADDVMSLIDIPDFGNYPHRGDCVLLDRIQDPGNAGTILRSMAASGIDTLVSSCGSTDIWSPKVLRAGMGAHFLLRIFSNVDVEQWLLNYQDPVWVTALGPNNISLYHLDLKQSGTWVFGNEGSGVQAAFLQAADKCVHIPMLGQTESLNVAMAATVCLFEQMRQRSL